MLRTGERHGESINLSEMTKSICEGFGAFEKIYLVSNRSVLFRSNLKKGSNTLKHWQCL